MVGTESFGSKVKNLPTNGGDMGSIPRSGSSPGEGNDDPLHYSCLRNPMNFEEHGELQSMGWQKSWIWLSEKKNNKNIYIFQIFVLGNMITPFRISLRISAFILLFMVLETKIWALGIIIIGVLLHLDSFGGLKKLYIYIYVFVYIILYMC